MAFVAFNFWINFWINLTGPFGAVYAYEQLGISPGQFALMNIFSTMTGALAMPLWGKFMDKHGCMPVIGLGLLLWQLQNFLWVALTPGTTWLLYPMFLWGGSVAAAFLLGSFNILLKIIPHDAKTAGISLNLAATSVAAGMAPILAGLILNFGQSMGWSTVVIYRIGFTISPVAILLSLLFLKRIREPEADPRYSTVWGATRMVRQSMQSIGLASLANTTLVGRKIRRPRRPARKPAASKSSPTHKDANSDPENKIE
ncbi:MAG: MFS transporter [Puniceicoccales bacterium]